MTWLLGLSFPFLPVAWSGGVKCVRGTWCRTGWQQQLQLHNRALVNPVLHQFWHGAQNVLLLGRLEGLCRQTLPFIHASDFSLVEMPGLVK